ncbi:MAG: pentapeptide repeat-containing protein [Candidatus Omnitrophota bacterium]
MAELIFDGKMGRIDMAELQDEFAKTKLMGAPQGYVGYDKNGGRLVQILRASPIGVLLLDELEKAHPDVLENLYDLFDTGTTQSSTGETLSATNHLIAMTSNLGMTPEIYDAYRAMDAIDLMSDEEFTQAQDETELAASDYSWFRVEITDEHRKAEQLLVLLKRQQAEYKNSLEQNVKLNLEHIKHTKQLIDVFGEYIELYELKIAFYRASVDAERTRLQSQITEKEKQIDEYKKAGKEVAIEDEPQKELQAMDPEMGRRVAAAKRQRLQQAAIQLRAYNKDVFNEVAELIEETLKPGGVFSRALNSVQLDFLPERLTLEDVLDNIEEFWISPLVANRDSALKAYLRAQKPDCVPDRFPKQGEAGRFARLDEFGLLPQERRQCEEAFGGLWDYIQKLKVMTSKAREERLGVCRLISQVNRHSEEAGKDLSSASRSQLLDVMEESIQDEIRKRINRYFINSMQGRIGEILVFKRLRKKEIEKIRDFILDMLKEKLANQGYVLNFDDAAKEVILKAGYDAVNGARPMARAIDNLIGSQLAEILVAKKYPKGTQISVSADSEGKITFKLTEPVGEVVRQQAQEALHPTTRAILAASNLEAKQALLPTPVAQVPPNAAWNNDKLKISLPIPEDADEASVDKIKQQEKELNEMVVNLTAFSSQGRIPEESINPETMVSVLSIQAQARRNFPLLWAKNQKATEQLVQQYSRLACEGKLNGQENVRVLSLKFSSFATTFSLAGKFEATVLRLLDAIADDDKKKGIRTVVYLDLDSFQKASISAQGRDGLPTGAEFHLGQFLSAFKDEQKGRLILSTSSEAVLRDPLYEQWFSRVDLLERSLAGTRDQLAQAPEAGQVEDMWLVLRRAYYAKHISPITGALPETTDLMPFELMEQALSLFAIALADEDHKMLLAEFLDQHYSAKAKEIGLQKQPVKEKRNIARVLAEKIKAAKRRSQPVKQAESLAEIRRWRSVDRQDVKLTPTIEDVRSFLIKRGVDSLLVSQRKTSDLLSLKGRIKARLVGQDEAVDLVVSAIYRAESGLKRPNKPVGSFLFSGPTGVGKTELARVVASELGYNYIHVPMADMDSSTRLIGAPPGYVGHDDSENWLTSQVKRNPKSVIVFDELHRVDKEEILMLLLSLTDDGRLTDSKGNTVSFSQCIIIFTSNGGVEETYDAATGRFLTPQTGGPDAYQQYKKALDAAQTDSEALTRFYDELDAQISAYHKYKYRPEFLARLDKIVPFKFMDEAMFKAMAEAKLKPYKNWVYKDARNKFYPIEVRVSPEHKTAVLDYFYKLGFEAGQGARPLANVLDKFKENLTKFASGLYERDAWNDGDAIEVFVVDGDLRFKFIPAVARVVGQEMTEVEAMQMRNLEELYQRPISEITQEAVTEALEITWMAIEETRGEALAMAGTETFLTSDINFCRPDREWNAEKQRLKTSVPKPDKNKQQIRFAMQLVSQWLTLAKKETAMRHAFNQEGRLLAEVYRQPQLGVRLRSFDGAQDQFVQPPEAGQIDNNDIERWQSELADSGITVSWLSFGNHLRLEISFSAPLRKWLKTALFEAGEGDLGNLCMQGKEYHALEPYFRVRNELRKLGATFSFANQTEQNTTKLFVDIPIDGYQEVEEKKVEAIFKALEWRQDEVRDREEPNAIYIRKTLEDEHGKIEVYLKKDNSELIIRLYKPSDANFSFELIDRVSGDSQLIYQNNGSLVCQRYAGRQAKDLFFSGEKNNLVVMLGHCALARDIEAGAVACDGEISGRKWFLVSPNATDTVLADPDMRQKVKWVDSGPRPEPDPSACLPVGMAPGGTSVTPQAPRTFEQLTPERARAVRVELANRDAKTVTVPATDEIPEVQVAVRFEPTDGVELAADVDIGEVETPDTAPAATLVIGVPVGATMLEIEKAKREALSALPDAILRFVSVASPTAPNGGAGSAVPLVAQRLAGVLAGSLAGVRVSNYVIGRAHTLFSEQHARLQSAGQAAEPQQSDASIKTAFIQAATEQLKALQGHSQLQGILANFLMRELGVSKTAIEVSCGLTPSTGDSPTFPRSTRIPILFGNEPTTPPVVPAPDAPAPPGLVASAATQAPLDEPPADPGMPAREPVVLTPEILKTIHTQDLALRLASIAAAERFDDSSQKEKATITVIETFITLNRFNDALNLVIRMEDDDPDKAMTYALIAQAQAGRPTEEIIENINKADIAATALNRASQAAVQAFIAQVKIEIGSPEDEISTSLNKAIIMVEEISIYDPWAQIKAYTSIAQAQAQAGRPTEEIIENINKALDIAEKLPTRYADATYDDQIRAYTFIAETQAKIGRPMNEVEDTLRLASTLTERTFAPGEYWKALLLLIIAETQAKIGRPMNEVEDILRLIINLIKKIPDNQDQPFYKTNAYSLVARVQIKAKIPKRKIERNLKNARAAAEEIPNDSSNDYKRLLASDLIIQVCAETGEFANAIAMAIRTPDSEPLLKVNAYTAIVQNQAQLLKEKGIDMALLDSVNRQMGNFLETIADETNLTDDKAAKIILMLLNNGFTLEQLQQQAVINELIRLLKESGESANNEQLIASLREKLATPASDAPAPPPAEPPADPSSPARQETARPAAEATAVSSEGWAETLQQLTGILNDSSKTLEQKIDEFNQAKQDYLRSSPFQSSQTFKVNDAFADGLRRLERTWYFNRQASAICIQLDLSRLDFSGKDISGVRLFAPFDLSEDVYLRRNAEIIARRGSGAIFSYAQYISRKKEMGPDLSQTVMFYSDLDTDKINGILLFIDARTWRRLDDVYSTKQERYDYLTSRGVIFVNEQGQAVDKDGNVIDGAVSAAAAPTADASAVPRGEPPASAPPADPANPPAADDATAVSPEGWDGVLTQLTAILSDTSKTLKQKINEFNQAKQDFLASSPLSEGEVLAVNFEFITAIKGLEQCFYNRGSTIYRLDLSRLNLRNAYLCNANLRNADISGVNLSGAVLSYAGLRGADLRGAILPYADLCGAILPYADLRNADLSGADLRGAVLSYADFRGADFTGADLTNANLSNADLCGTTLTGASLANANLSGARMLFSDLDKDKIQDAMILDSGSYKSLKEVTLDMDRLYRYLTQERGIIFVNEQGQRVDKDGKVIESEVGTPAPVAPAADAPVLRQAQDEQPPAPPDVTPPADPSAAGPTAVSPEGWAETLQQLTEILNDSSKTLEQKIDEFNQAKQDYLRSSPLQDGQTVVVNDEFVRALKSLSEASYFKNAVFYRLDLSKFDFSGKDLSGVKLRYADLSGAKLSRAILTNAILSYVNLIGADLSSADLSRTNLFNANLTGANLSNSRFFNTRLTRAILYNADLSTASLFKANLSEADLRGVDLSFADLSDADLFSAKMFHGDLNGNKIRNATIRKDRNSNNERLGVIYDTEQKLYDFFKKKGVIFVDRREPTRSITAALLREGGGRGNLLRFSAFVVALPLHEAAHILTAKLFGLKVNSINLWSSADINYEGASTWKKVATLLAGPFANLTVGGIALGFSFSAMPIVLGFIGISNIVLFISDVIISIMAKQEVKRQSDWNQAVEALLQRAGASSDEITDRAGTILSLEERARVYTGESPAEALSQPSQGAVNLGGIDLSLIQIEALNH